MPILHGNPVFTSMPSATAMGINASHHILISIPKNRMKIHVICKNAINRVSTGAVILFCALVSTGAQNTDYTHLIRNYSFEYISEGVLKPADGVAWKPLEQNPSTNFYGWNCDLSILGNTSQGINNDMNNREGNHGVWIAGNCVLPEMYEFYQIIDPDSLPAGTYRVQCRLNVPGSDYITSQRLFANNSVQYFGSSDKYLNNLTAGEINRFAGYTPSTTNSKVDLREMTVYVTIADGDSLKIGIRTGGKKGDGSTALQRNPMHGWFKADYFRLTKIDADRSHIRYKHNLLNKNSYFSDSGFNPETPAYRLWDGVTSEGVNDLKATGDTEAWIEFDFGQNEEIAEAKLFQDHGGNRVTHWKVTSWNGETWEDVFPYTESNTAGWQAQTFDVETRKVRFYAKCTVAGYNVSIHEIELYTKPSAQQRKIVVGCIGDSNTATGSASDKGLYTWPVQLENVLGNSYQVKNLGYSGATLQNAPADLPWTGTSQYDRHRDLNAAISIIALGTNDSKSKNWIANSPARYREDYINLIEEIQHYPSLPEVCLLMPIKAFSGTAGINNAVVDGEIRPIVRDIAKTMGVTLIDGYSATENLGHLLPDGIHLNDEGLRILTGKIASVLQTPKPLITTGEQILPAVYAEYRWYRNGVLIAGATGASYTAIQAGSYKVAVKLNAETDDVILSSDFEVQEPNVDLVVSDGIANNITLPDIPEIKISHIADRIQVENAVGRVFSLFDICGNQLRKITLRNACEYIDTGDLPGGLYIYRAGIAGGKIFK
jgi:lysophospholipase L1-like esterase